MKYNRVFKDIVLTMLSLTATASFAQTNGVLSSPVGVTNKMLPEVWMVYLIPSDRVFHGDYAAAVEQAIEQLQAWYQSQLTDTKAFELHKPVVEVISTSHASVWYSTNPAGADPSLWFWFNALSDGFAALGGSFNDPNNR